MRELYPEVFGVGLYKFYTLYKNLDTLNFGVGCKNVLLVKKKKGSQVVHEKLIKRINGNWVSMILVIQVKIRFNRKAVHCSYRGACPRLLAECWDHRQSPPYLV